MVTHMREAVGVFHDERSFEAAIDELLGRGFDRAEISLVAGHEAVERELGHRYERVSELEDDPHVPRIAYVDVDSRNEGSASMVGGLAYVGAIAASGMVVASGGTLGIAVAAAALAGGGGVVLGAFLARMVGGRHARELQRQLEEGGLLLWVRVASPEREEAALDALSRHSAEDVHVHELPIPPHLLTGGVSRQLSFMQQLGL